MASGETLVIFTPYENEPPSSAYATIGARNLHPVLAFNDTTSWAAVFSAVMPENYINTTGVTVYLTWMAVATSGNVGWTVAFERMDSATDLDSDSFASAQTVTAQTVPSTSGQPYTSSLAITKGANMDSVVKGDAFRLKIARDVANDTAVGDAQLLSVELRET